MEFSYFKGVLRTPLKSFDLFREYSKGNLSDYNDNDVVDGIYLASEHLYNEINENLKLEKKARYSLNKYLIRLATRCTPYGYFSGINLFAINSKSTEFKIKSKGIPKTRLDMEYLVRLYYHLSNNVTILKKLSYTPNTSLFKINNKWRFHRYTIVRDILTYELVTVNSNIVLNKLLSISNISFEKGLNLLVDYDIPIKEAESYLLHLIENQILVSDIYPNVSGDEFQNILFDKLYSIGEFKPAIDNVKKVLVSNKTVIEKTKTISNIVENQFGVKVTKNQLIQVDLLKEPILCEFNETLIQDIIKDFKILNSLNTYTGVNEKLNKFKKTFYNKYQDSEIPLLKVLDSDFGINYNKLDLESNGTNQIINKDEIDKIKLDIYSKCLKTNSKEIDISEFINNRINLTQNNLPDTFCFMGSLINTNEGESLVWGGISSNAVATIGRFTYLDPQIEELCLLLCKKEQELYPNSILAEIVHISEGRQGNILSRKKLREYEIPYLSASILDEGSIIRLQDLSISIRNNRIVLYCKRTKKEILPRMSNAHNYSSSKLPIYNFLCDLQYQGINEYVNWNWGLLSDQEYLPRILHGRNILALAKWNIPGEHISKLKEISGEAKYIRFNEIINNIV